MRLQQDSLTNTKNYIHAAQAFVVLVAWILTIAIYVANGSTDGRTSWFFALVSTLPAPPKHPKAKANVLSSAGSPPQCSSTSS